MISRKIFLALFGILIFTNSGSTDPFSYNPPGRLEAPGASGFVDDFIFLPNIRFPLEAAPAFANSQVYRRGGSIPGSQCHALNYSYPWFDNFCEPRDRRRKAALCRGGIGHQGQDIRAATCHKSRHWAVAAENGKVFSIGSYSVYIQGESGNIYGYLHLDMDNLRVRKRDYVKRGQRIGQVSNSFGGEPTTIHLHFEVKGNLRYNGRTLSTFIPPYTSLTRAYKRLLDGQE